MKMKQNKEIKDHETAAENRFDTHGTAQESGASDISQHNSDSEKVSHSGDPETALHDDISESGAKSGRATYPDASDDGWPVCLREAEVAYGRKKKQGEFTLEDYYALPDEERVELIDGVIYDMSAPVASHQSIVAGLTAIFYFYIKNKNGDCKVFPGPIDVQLDCDDRTMVQPDVLILCDRDKLKNGIVYGAPDFVVEVLSPSTSRKDRTIKLRKYREAGVREYWIIDLKRREVEVYIFRDPKLMTLPRVYGFEDIIPVGIYNGDCTVDFSMISQDIRGM